MALFLVLTIWCVCLTLLKKNFKTDDQNQGHLVEIYIVLWCDIKVEFVTFDLERQFSIT